MTEFVDGHRWPTEPGASTPEVAARTATAADPRPASGGCRAEGIPSEGGPASRDHGAPDVPAATDSDQRSLLADLTVDVHPGYCMRPDTIALHFPLTAVPALCALFPTEAGKIHAAALAVEQEAEWEADRIRGRQLAGGGA